MAGKTASWPFYSMAAATCRSVVSTSTLLACQERKCQTQALMTCWNKKGESDKLNTMLSKLCLVIIGCWWVGLFMQPESKVGQVSVRCDRFPEWWRFFVDHQNLDSYRQGCKHTGPCKHVYSIMAWMHVCFCLFLSTYSQRTAVQNTSSVTISAMQPNQPWIDWRVKCVEG